MELNSRHHNWIIHPAGLPFLGLAIAAGILLWWLAPWSVVLSVPVCVFIAAFFRNPHRIIPIDESAILSPADGRIVEIAPARPPAELNDYIKQENRDMIRIAVFMNVFNIHVNRAPCMGTVTGKSYKPGAFFNASLDKASEANERLGLVITPKSDSSIAVVQIAGLIARRIVCWCNFNDSLESGQRYGLIRFGSRVDVYIPASANIIVSVDQIVRGGSDILAFFKPDITKKGARTPIVSAKRSQKSSKRPVTSKASSQKRARAKSR